MAATPKRIILASASAARAAVLAAAGVDFAIEPAAVDEARLKRDSRQAGESAIGCASALAAEKACCISRRHPTALVIGADQILAIGAEWFDKPADLARGTRAPAGIARPDSCAGDRRVRGVQREEAVGRDERA
jgi:predicted house-cleaning NTP pyrophosphatase (Maf/HAM1 superfamily)